MRIKTSDLVLKLLAVLLPAAAILKANVELTVPIANTGYLVLQSVLATVNSIYEVLEPETWIRTGVAYSGSC